MSTWCLSVRPAPEMSLPPVDVVVEAEPDATVHDLARALGRHLVPTRRGELIVPTDSDGPWPASRRLSECALRSGDLLEVVGVPTSWQDRAVPAGAVRAIARVIAGPDAGRVVPIRSRSMTIGRGPGSTLTLVDPLVSTRHARVVFDAIPMVSDEGSANGTLLDGEPVRRSTGLTWGSRLTVGASTIVFERGDRAASGDHEDSDSLGRTTASVWRSPRFGEPLLDEEIEVSAPPTKRKPPVLPWAMLLLPMIMGMGMLATMRSPYTLIYAFGWPVLGYFGWWQQKRTAAKEFAEETRLWQKEFDAAAARVSEQALRQRDQLDEDHPDPAEMHRLLGATEAGAALWNNRIESPEFLRVRIGRGPVPTLLRATVKDGGDYETRQGALAAVAEQAVIDNAPVLADLAAVTVAAIVGEPSDVDDTMRALALRHAVGHSPADLSIAAILAPSRAHHESWLRWLPHCATRISGEPPIAIGATDGARLLDRLSAEEPGRAHTVVFIDEAAGLSRRSVEAVAARAAGPVEGATGAAANEPAHRLHLVWLAASATTVPAATEVLLDIPGGTLDRRDRSGRTVLTRVDGLDLAAAWRAARLMTSRVDEAAVLPPDTALPPVVRLPEVSADLRNADDVDGVLQRWSSSTGLRAQIGRGVDGVVSLDLREDGPHGLVAGTTGSGKSELLQSLIASLAVNNSPERITFLLVDYKGGAAFRECADLPHTVGYITDLTPALVHRALTSLGADIARREALLAEFGVKDLTQLEREFPDQAPPSLLICVDEFAALTAEVPDFVDGMVNIAQRGRSLGMHVLLATQRPAGVITPAIRANADLRIALRVGAVDDSRDVIEMADAARISRRTPGRAWIRRTGHGTAELVQAAWLGAREPMTDTRASVTVEAFGAAASVAGTAGGGSGSGAAGGQRLHPQTDLERCVATITEAHRRTGRPAPRKPWLPQLPAELLLSTEQLLESAPNRTSGQVPLGRIDEPARQSQPELVVDYSASGHLLVFGASGSGKTELLRTVAIAASVTDAANGRPGGAPYIYGLDFAGGGLSVLADLPTVGAVIPEAQSGRVLRLLRVLRRTVADRSQAMANAGAADLDGLARAGQAVPRVHVLIDNLPALLEFLETGGALRRSHGDMLTAILQNGRRVGVHVTATAPGRSGVPTAVGSTFGRRLVLRMTSPDDYMMLGVPNGILDLDSPAGQGLSGKHSVQLATLGDAGTPIQLDRIAQVALGLGEFVEGRGSGDIPGMPGLVPAAALPAPVGSSLPVAVDAESVAVVSHDVLAAPLLIAGRGASGRTGALAALARLARRSSNPPTQIVYAAGAAASSPGGGEVTLPEASMRSAFDRVITDPAELLAVAETWRSGLAATRTSDPGAWMLVLVDDAHLWDRDAESGGSTRPAVTALATLLGGATSLGIGLVVASDTDEARTRPIGVGLVPLVRRARRGVLLAPDGMDGSVFGVTVPLQPLEPMTGPGRGLWCAEGAFSLVQVAYDTGEPEADQDVQDVDVTTVIEQDEPFGAHPIDSRPDTGPGSGLGSGPRTDEGSDPMPGGPTSTVTGDPR